MKFEKTWVYGLEPAIIGMRLPMSKNYEDALSKCDSFNMSDEDKSAVLLYAVYEDKDNTDLINAVTSHFTQPLLVGDYQQQLGNLKNHDKLNADNYAALINSGTQLADMLKRILGD